MTKQRCTLQERRELTRLEVWRAIPLHLGYEVSSWGRVRSVDRVIVRQGRNHYLKGRILKPWRNRKYLSVALGISHKELIHVLVLAAFEGEKHNGMICRHLDGDHSNNRLDNLEWGTYSENMIDRIRLGEKRGWMKLTRLQAEEIRELYVKAPRYKSGKVKRGIVLSLSKKYGVSTVMIRLIGQNKTWRKEHLDDIDERAI